MNKGLGFTMIELMVSIAIVGILFATAVPAYNAYRERARGAEATIVIKQIMDSQIAYFLDNETFFPPPDEPIEISHIDEPDDPEIEAVYNNLNIRIVPGRFLNYGFYHALTADGPEFTLIITSEGGFNLPGGSPMIGYVLNDEGYISDAFGL